MPPPGGQVVSFCPCCSRRETPQRRRNLVKIQEQHMFALGQSSNLNSLRGGSSAAAGRGPGRLKECAQTESVRISCFAPSNCWPPPPPMATLTCAHLPTNNLGCSGLPEPKRAHELREAPIGFWSTTHSQGIAGRQLADSAGSADQPASQRASLSSDKLWSRSTNSQGWR